MLVYGFRLLGHDFKGSTVDRRLRAYALVPHTLRFLMPRCGCEGLLKGLRVRAWKLCGSTV